MKIGDIVFLIFGGNYGVKSEVSFAVSEAGKVPDYPKILDIISIRNWVVWVRYVYRVVGCVAHGLPLLKFYLDKFFFLVLPLATLAVV